MRARVLFLHHAVTDVGPIEAGDELACPRQPELLDDLGAGHGVRGGRQGDTRHLGVALVEDGEPDVLRPEVVAPLRYAVGLIDGEKRQAASGVERVQETKKALCHQPLGRHVDEIQLAGQQPLDDHAGRFRIQAGIQEGSPGARLGERVDLILHERDQR